MLLAMVLSLPGESRDSWVWRALSDRVGDTKQVQVVVRSRAVTKKLWFACLDCIRASGPASREPAGSKGRYASAIYRRAPSYKRPRAMKRGGSSSHWQLSVPGDHPAL